MHEASEFDKLLEIYNRYPITELTIHPRVRQDFYKGKVRESDFAAALSRCSMPVCYNGRSHHRAGRKRRQRTLS